MYVEHIAALQLSRLWRFGVIEAIDTLLECGDITAISDVSETDLA